MSEHDESVITVPYNSEDILDYEINYIDSEGDIKIRNFNPNSISLIPFQKTYCSFIYKNKLCLLRCKSITNNSVKLYYPLKRICEFYDTISYGATKDEFNSAFPDKASFEKFQREQFLNTKPIFSEAIYETTVGGNNTYFYIGEDNKPHTIYSGPCNNVRFLNEYYMILQHISFQETDTKSIIYYFDKETKRPTELYNGSKIDITDFRDFEGKVTSTVCFFKLGEKRSYYVYGIFEGYKNKFPYEDSSTSIPNKFFSTKDEYKIRNHRYEIIKYESFIIITNNKKKENILMLDGNFMFDKWADNIKCGDSTITITYTDDNGEMKKHYLSFSKFKEHYHKNIQLKL